MAWTCFQLGALWGELATDSDADLAAAWYGRTIEYLPSYVKARVHLAEIRADDGRLADAEALLQPVLASGDPEVTWRLADILALRERREEAVAQLGAARSRFEELLARHELAFADAAEFYAGSGGDGRRALELARVNAANRPTRRALAQAQAMEALAC